MNGAHFCLCCVEADPNRTKDGHIRCTRFSEWRNPTVETDCNYFMDRNTAKVLELIKSGKEPYFSRKAGKSTW